MEQVPTQHVSQDETSEDDESFNEWGFTYKGMPTIKTATPPRRESTRWLSTTLGSHTIICLSPRNLRPQFTRAMYSPSQVCGALAWIATTYLARQTWSVTD